MARRSTVDLRTTVSPVQLGEWGLVGRHVETEQVLAALEAGQDIALLGPAGVGKTRLAQAVSDHVIGAGGTVRWVRASPGALTLALAPFRGLLGGERDDPVGAARRALLAGATERSPRPLLIVDDAHVLDATSAGLVHQLAMDGDVGVLVLARAGATPPEGISAVLRSDATVTIQPAPLGREASADLVTGRLGGPVEPRSLQRLIDVAQGNPLYLREIVEGAVAGGALIGEAGLWRLRGELRATPLLEDVVLARLTALDEASLEALELVALAGSIDLEILGRVTDPVVLESLERAGYLRVATGADHVTVDVGHPLFGELLRERLPALGSLRLHRVLAEAASAALAEGHLGDRPLLKLQVAVWSHRGGVAVGSETLLDAAEMAVGLGDTELGAMLGAAACRDASSARPALLTAWCLAEQGEHLAAVACIEAHRPLVVEPWERAAMTLRLAEEHWWWGRDPARARAVLADEISAGGAAVALLEAQDGVFAMLDGHIGDAIAAGRLFIDHKHPWVRFVAGLALAQGLAYADQGAEGADVAATLFADLQDERTELIGDVGLHTVGMLVGMLYDGRVEEARGLASAIDAVAQSQPARQARAWGAILCGLTALVSGELDLARRRMVEAELLWVECGLPGIARWCGTGVALAASGQGDPTAAAAALDRVATYDCTGFELFEPLHHLARTWGAMAAHDEAGARASAAAAVQCATRGGSWAFLVQVAHDLARLGLVDLAEQALTMLPGGSSVLSKARIAYVQAAVVADAGGFEAAGVAFEAIGASLFAAEAHAEAARLRRRAGQRRAALHNEGRVGSLLLETGSVATPPLAARARPGPLSAREHEVAQLAAAGRSNKEIAGMLIVSERTVENHLYRSFIKLGVAGRGDLAAALAATKG